VFSSYSYSDHRNLHSFPTRRSSDLDSNKKKYGDKDQLEQEETTKNSDDILKKFEVLLSHPTWSLGAWYRALNQFSGKFEEPVERSEEHTSELQSRENLVCRLLLEKK